MRAAIIQWLKLWGVILGVLLGFPTLGFTWCLIYAWGFSDDPWRLRLVTATEAWLHNLRKFALFIAGFPTLGYAWFLIDKFEEPLFLNMRMKHSRKA